MVLKRLESKVPDIIQDKVSMLHTMHKACNDCKALISDFMRWTPKAYKVNISSNHLACKWFHETYRTFRWSSISASCSEESAGSMSRSFPWFVPVTQGKYIRYGQFRPDRLQLNYANHVIIRVRRAETTNSVIK
jgi:hypothetical protein